MIAASLALFDKAGLELTYAIAIVAAVAFLAFIGARALGSRARATPAASAPVEP
jgi:hypothetical protein